MKIALIAIVQLFLVSFVFSQQLIPYKNPALSIEKRVSDLLSRMTPDEKFRQLFMVAGDLGNDSTQFKEGIFGFQINTVVQQVTAANQMMQYNAGQNAQQTARKINSIQRYLCVHAIAANKKKYN